MASPASIAARRSASAARVLRVHELTSDTPKEQLRKLEWACWSALGEIIVMDAGPRYECAEIIAAHLYVAGAAVND